MPEFAPEVIFYIGAFPVTNTILNTLLVDAIIIGLVYYLKNHVKLIPGIFQSIVEYVIEAFYKLTENVAGKNAATIFPFMMSFFLFILFANWSGLFPGISSFGFYEGAGASRHFVPLLRNTTSDLNTTLALAIISLIATHTLSLRAIGIKDYFSRYFSLNPVMLYVGILEIIGEITKVISLSFRLFGNIFAGEVVLTTIAGLFAFLAPIPFVMLEIIVGLVQALVFSMLTMAFMAVLMTPHHEAAHESVHESKGVISV